MQVVKLSLLPKKAKKQGFISEGRLLTFSWKKTKATITNLAQHSRNKYPSDYKKVIFIVADFFPNLVQAKYLQHTRLKDTGHTCSGDSHCFSRHTTTGHIKNCSCS